MTYEAGRIDIKMTRFADNPSIRGTINIPGIASWDVGFPASGDDKADVIALLRRMADNLERGPRLDR